MAARPLMLGSMSTRSTQTARIPPTRAMPEPRDVRTSPPLADGQLEYLKRLQRYFRGQLGLPMSGQSLPYKTLSKLATHRPPSTSTTMRMAVSPPTMFRTLAAFPPTVLASPYQAMITSITIISKRYARRASPWQQGLGLGGFARAHPSQTANGVQLLRALPNWDNLVNATARSWNPDTLCVPDVQQLCRSQCGLWSPPRDRQALRSLSEPAGSVAA